VLQAGAKVPDYLLLTPSQSVASSPGNALTELGYLAQMLIAGSTRAVWLIIDLPEGANLGMMLPLVLFELVLGFYLGIFGMRKENP
jgi:hypothetical protein